MHVVVVESPAKAKTINKYLGSDYQVLASFGHVRDLPAKDGSVRPDNDFEMIYEINPKAAKYMKQIVDAVKQADALSLATDPDREGEAISWHVLEALRQRKALNGIKVQRVVFSEITRRAVLDAMAHPRQVDMDLVNAQQARRALDYLVGFTLSPVLWRKLPGARSAGRVQSVALRLICEREFEIETFKAREYWTVEAAFEAPDGSPFEARLTRLDGTRLDKFDLADRAAAEAVAARIAAQPFAVTGVEVKPTRRNPQPPFITSTLQQEASRKLGFAAKRTMSIAQRLYEGIELDGETAGLITYMRTDGVQLAAEAVSAIRAEIGRRYGDSYLPEKPRVYATKAKNAQEAHEAIRPTDVHRHPDDLRRVLSDEQWRLYDLIWKRALASQMAAAAIERTAVDLGSDDGTLVLRASGSVIRFPGFLKLYQEGRDDNGRDTNGGADDEKRLPALSEGDRPRRTGVTPSQHFTEPPPRYSEASLVKKLEELGIGRPSTYASIISVLQDRGYVTLEKKRFVPNDQGLIVTAFLSTFFSRYVGYDFTASLEQKLDEISAAHIDWKAVLREFWAEFSQAIAETEDLRRAQVIDALDAVMAAHLFPAREDGRDPRACPTCADGRLGLRLSKNGPFIGCSNYPECRYTRNLGPADESDDATTANGGPVELGTDPESGLPVSLRRGPYGLYLQLGEALDGAKPKRVSIPKDVDPATVDLAFALRLLSLPRLVGQHPEWAKPIHAGIGRYGPFVECDRVYGRLQGTEEVLSVGLNRAVDLLAEAKQKRGRRQTAEPLRTLGPAPDGGGEIQVLDGQYGPYVKLGRINATLPKDLTPDTVTLDQALALIAERAARKGKAKGRTAKAKGGKKKKAPARRANAAGSQG